MEFLEDTKLVIISDNTSFVKKVEQNLHRCTWIKRKYFKSLELFLTSDIISRTIVLHHADQEISSYELNLQKRLPDLKLIRVNEKRVDKKPHIDDLTQKIILNSLAYSKRLN